MKNFWKKALGITALAALVPVRFEKDEESGKKTFQSLLWKLDVGPGKYETTEIGLDLMEGVLTAPLMKAVTAKKETVHFADDDPEAAVVPDVIDMTQADGGEDASAGEPAEPTADAQTAEETTEEDFDPEM